MSRISKFLDLYDSPNTVRVYKRALTKFFHVVYGDNEAGLEQHGDRYFTETRNIQEDIQSFFVSIKDNAPKTRRLMLSAVRSFLMENDVELKEKFWRNLRRRIKGTRALTVDRIPSNLELRKIIMHMPLNGKALFLTQASSGMRIGEVLQLTLEDLDINADPVKIQIRGEYTKSGNPRTTFISKEAKELLEEWLKLRSQYLKTAVRRSRLHPKSSEDLRVFPFESVTAYAIWRNAVEKAGLLKKDKQTNRFTVHPHVLRKFFRTRMASIIPVDVTEALMGHEGYLTEVYRKYSHEDLAKFYRQGETSLCVFTTAEEVVKLRAEVKEQNKQLQILVNGLTAENMELKGRVEKLEKLAAPTRTLLKILNTTPETSSELRVFTKQMKDNVMEFVRLASETKKAEKKQ